MSVCMTPSEANARLRAFRNNLEGTALLPLYDKLLAETRNIPPPPAPPKPLIERLQSDSEINALPKTLSMSEWIALIEGKVSALKRRNRQRLQGRTRYPVDPKEDLRKLASLAIAACEAVA